MTLAYYRGAHGILVVYDITDPDTFTNVGKWLNCIETAAPEDTLKTLVGNKSDCKNRQVSTEAGRSLAEENDMSFFETSAKLNENVEECIYGLIMGCYQVQKAKNITPPPPLPPPQDPQDRNCRC
eukprot:TRINITY_DN7792_c0_g1_i1.p2 TRINITY_DN7792_c0_g1~~TRINITY_DN7792_c0_g1_i1.p2  ORF type:complete len:125 (-),score=21.20 TRINITY_DN7792_c0_g1_i1:92-466(-)